MILQVLSVLSPSNFNSNSSLTPQVPWEEKSHRAPGRHLFCVRVGTRGFAQKKHGETHEIQWFNRVCRGLLWFIKVYYGLFTVFSHETGFMIFEQIVGVILIPSDGSCWPGLFVANLIYWYLLHIGIDVKILGWTAGEISGWFNHFYHTSPAYIRHACKWL